MTPVKAVLFDFDGTLVQLRAAPGAMDELRDGLGRLFAEAGVRSTLRPFYPEVDRALGELRQRGDAEATRLQDRAVALIEEYELAFSRRSEVCPHAVDAWKAASSRFSCGISSSNTRAAIQHALTMHGIWDGRSELLLVAFEDVERHKPDPAPLVRLAAMLRLGADDVAVHVGDHVNDLEACRRFNQRGGARLVPVMVRGGKCRWEDVVAHAGFHPAGAIDDLSQLVPLLESGAP